MLLSITAHQASIEYPASTAHNQSCIYHRDWIIYQSCQYHIKKPHIKKPSQCLPPHHTTTPQQVAHQRHQRQQTPHHHHTRCQTCRLSNPHRLRSRNILFQSSTGNVSCKPSSTHRPYADFVIVSSSSTSTPTKTTKARSGKDGLTTEERKLRNEARASYFSTLG